MIQQQSQFDNPLPSGWEDSNSKNYPPFALVEGSEDWSHAITEDVKRLSKSSWRMEVRPGDQAVYFGGYRAEITMTNKGSAQTYRPNSFRLSTYVPSGVFATDPNPVGFPFQNHPYSPSYDGGSGSFYIEVRDDQYNARILHTNGNTSTSAKEIIITKPIGKVERDVWVDWICYYYPKPGNDGRVIIWRRVLGRDNDYKIAVDYTGPCLHAWSQWPYLKMGVYWWLRPATGPENLKRLGYIDEVAFGQSTPENVVNEFRIEGPANQPPVANAGPDKVLAEGVTSTILDGEGTDPDKNPLTPRWSQLSGVPALIQENEWNPTVTGLGNGESVFRLTVTDSAGATHTDDVKVIASIIPPKEEVYVFNSLKEGQEREIVCYNDGTWNEN